MDILTTKHIVELARRLYANKIDWIDFYRQVLGLDSLVRRAMPDAITRTEFEHTDEYRQILTWMADLRTDRHIALSEKVAGKVITVRLPDCVHEALMEDAHQMYVSLNQLCVSKLLVPITPALVTANNPVKFQRRSRPK